jgi:hypothetical protein
MCTPKIHRDQTRSWPVDDYYFGQVFSFFTLSGRVGNLSPEFFHNTPSLGERIVVGADWNGSSAHPSA